METSLAVAGGRSGTQHYVYYAAYAACDIAVLAILAQWLPALPPVGVALVWAVLSVAAAAPGAYHLVIRKEVKSLGHEPGGTLAKLDNGRIVGFIVVYVLAAVFVAGLLLALPGWHMLDWWVAVLSALAIPFVWRLMLRAAQTQYIPRLRASRALLWACALVATLMLAANLALLVAQPPATYSSAAEAFLATANPFDNSPSALLGEVGTIKAFQDGLIAIGISKAAEVSGWVPLVIRLALAASGLFGLASLFGAGLIGKAELRRVFLPLNTTGDTGVVVRFVATAAVLPVILAGAFLCANHEVAQAIEDRGHSFGKQFVSDSMDIVVYVLDGKYYDQVALDEKLVAITAESDALAQDAQATLVPLINASFDKRIENVDGYLDWYYDLWADYGRLLDMFKGSLEDKLEDEFAARIEQGVDDTQLSTEFNAYFSKAEAIRGELDEALEQCEIDLPAWMYKTAEPLDAAKLTQAVEPASQLLSAGARFGINSATGITVGVIAGKVTARVLEKTIFSKTTSKIATSLAKFGITAGSLTGPVGLVAGVAAWVVSDYALLKADEALNRATYKEELVSAIEAERAEMLSMVQGLSTPAA